MSNFCRSIVAIVWVFLFLTACPPALSADDATASFRTARVHRGDLTITLDAKGTLEPEQVAEISAEVTGRIARLGPDPRSDADPEYKGKTIDYSSPVEAGTLLARIDDAAFVIAVERAKTAIALARAELEQADAKLELARLRAKQTEGKPVAPNPQKDDAEAEKKLYEASAAVARARLSEAELALRHAQLQLDRTKVVSPIKGLVIDRRIEPGQVVASNPPTSLFLIAADLKKMQIYAPVMEMDIPKVHKGQSASFTCDAFPDRLFVARVTEVRLNATSAPVVEIRPNEIVPNNVATYTVALSVDNADRLLLPYLSVKTQIQIDRRKDVLLVPNAALSWRPKPQWVAAGVGHPPLAGRTQVWVRDKEFVRPLDVQIGATDGKMSEVVLGELKDGEQVVIGEGLFDSANENPNRPSPPRR